MSINALATLNDGSYRISVDLEPMIDATCDTALIKAVTTGDLGDKEVLREFLTDLNSPELKDMLDYADHSRQDITLAVVDGSLQRYLRHNRPGIMARAKSEIAAAIAIQDLGTAARLCDLQSVQYRAISIACGNAVFGLLIAMSFVDASLWRWVLAGVAAAMLVGAWRFSYSAGFYRSATLTCRNGEQLRNTEKKLDSGGMKYRLEGEIEDEEDN